MNVHAIELQDVSVVRRGHAILADTSLRVAPGSCCAILGPNGSGKSTLLSVLGGYTWPSAGSVRVGGHVYGRVDLARVRRRIGLIEPSRSPAFDERACVREVVATGLNPTPVNCIKSVDAANPLILIPGKEQGPPGDTILI